MTRMVGLGLLCALLVGCGDDDDGGDDTPMVDADPLAPDGSDEPIDGGVMFDADPNAVPEPIFADSLGGTGGVYVASRADKTALLNTSKKLDDEEPDNFVGDLAVVGVGIPSHRVVGGGQSVTSLVSGAVEKTTGHLLGAFHTGINPTDGSSLFRNQPFVYDGEADDFLRITTGVGEEDEWGGFYPLLSGDGTRLLYYLENAPAGTTAKFSYLVDLENFAPPGMSQAPLDLNGTGHMSYDGELLTIVTTNQLVAADVDASPDVYVFDFVTKDFVLVSEEGLVDTLVQPMLSGKVGGGYRVAYHRPPEGNVGNGTIVVCDGLPGRFVCEDAAPALVECTSFQCLTTLSISPNGRWLAFSTIKLIDAAHDAGGLLDVYRVDLNAVFSGGTAAPIMLSRNPTDYPSGAKSRLSGHRPQMNDDGSAFFMDQGDLGSSFGLWLSPAY